VPLHSLREVVRRLGGLAAAPRPDTDGALLRAYAAGDERAFAELVRRHGPLVWGVCARSLPSEQDAEDAFQATFFVLARKAASVRNGDALASWLFGVARRAASVVRRRAGHTDPRPPLATAPDPCAELASAEACDAILEEVRRLPEKYRLPLLLCGLEGLTKAQAARQLGWREGTVSGRLARARELLRRRLARRDLITADCGLAALGAAVPRSLQEAAAAGALRFAAGETADSPSASDFAWEVLRSMHTTSLKQYACVFGACVLAAVAGGLAYSQRQPLDEPRGEAAKLGEGKAGTPGAPAWRERLVLRGYAGSAYGEFSPDGRTFATADGRNVLRFLDTATWKERSRCPLTKYPKGTYFPQWHPFSPDGRLFALAWRVPAESGKGRRYETWLIEPATGKVRTVLEGNEPRFCPAGTLLALHCPEAVVLYDYAAGKEVRKLPTGGPVAWRGDWFSPDGRRLFLPTSDGRGKLWDVGTGKALATLEGFNPAWSKDGTSLATVLPGPLVKLWDAATGKERATLRGFDQPSCNVAFSPDGRLVLTSVSEAPLRADGEIDMPTYGKPYKRKRSPLDVRLWDAQTGKELVRLPGEREHCRGGAFAPDGKTVAYVRLTDDLGYKPETVLWDVAAGKERLVLRDDEGIDGVTFTPDGAAVLGHVGSHDRAQLHVWDAATGRVRARLGSAQGAYKFSPDGKLLVLTVYLPVEGPLTKPVPTRMEVRIFQWSEGPVTSETRGEPIAIKRDPADEPKPPSEAAKALEALKKEAEAAEAEFAKNYDAAKTDGERQALEGTRLVALEKSTAGALDVARKYPKDPAAVDALEYALRCTVGMEGKLGTLGGQAVARVRETLVTSPSLDKLLPWLGFHQSEASRALLREALEKNPDRKVRARACYWLAQALTDLAEAARQLRQSPELAERPEAKDRREHMKMLRATDPEATERRAEELFKRMRKEFADVKRNDFQPTTLGELAERALFSLRHLVVGKAAPEIEGKDLDGKPLKLSDYQGKVVVLIFCGHWCGPCRAMNPHKQELVKRHAGKPFALLEVNSDDDPGEWKRVMKKEGYAWRCWADGGTEGPIAKRWNISRWPTVYVLDAKGVIRHKELHDEPLSKAVDALLAEGARK
jgi:RNA polymerase sigma factor (sigma-70 family)